MIKTVLFDLGNVILPFDVMRLAHALSSYCRLDANSIVNRLWNEEIANEFETGRMSPQTYFETVCKACGFKGLTFSEFIPLFNEIFQEDTGVTDLVSRLKKNYRLGLISNTNEIHVAYILQKFPALFHFERHWWSNEAGVRKPDPKIFKMALDHFETEPAHTVFIDDLPVNVGSAKEIGINAILFQGVEPLKAELNRLGVVH